MHRRHLFHLTSILFYFSCSCGFSGSEAASLCSITCRVLYFRQLITLHAHVHFRACVIESSRFKRAFSTHELSTSLVVKFRNIFTESTTDARVRPHREIALFVASAHGRRVRATAQSVATRGGRELAMKMERVPNPAPTSDSSSEFSVSRPICVTGHLPSS